MLSPWQTSYQVIEVCYSVLTSIKRLVLADRERDSEKKPQEACKCVGTQRVRVESTTQWYSVCLALLKPGSISSNEGKQVRKGRKELSPRPVFDHTPFQKHQNYVILATSQCFLRTTNALC